MTLTSSDLHGCRAFRVVVSDLIDPCAYRIAPHQPSIVRFQKFRHNAHIFHSGIEPQVVSVWIEDDGHSIMYRRSHRIRVRSQDRTRFYPLPAGGFPAIPDSCECEQASVADFKTIRLFCVPLLLPLIEAVSRNYASAGLHRIPERWQCGRCLESRINHLGGCRRILRP